MIRENFTDAEWITLRAALHAVFLEIAIADRMLTDAEGAVWTQLLDESLPFASLLVRNLDPDEDAAVLDSAAFENWADLIRQSHAILRAKPKSEYPQAFNQTLRALMLSVAEADGDVAVKEAEFIAELEALLSELEA